MLAASTVTRPAAAAAAASAGPLRGLRSPAPLHPRPRRSALPPLRSSDKHESAVRAAEDSAAGGGHTEFEALARQVVGSLASEFASNDDSTYHKLSQWLRGSHEEEEEAELAPRSDQATEESSTKRLLRVAAESYGVPTTVGGAVDSVKHWLSNPSHGEESHDVQMVARLVHRLLDSYEKKHGEEFGGQDEQQYDKLYTMARSVLGSSMSKKVVTRLVRSYLKI